MLGASSPQEVLGFLWVIEVGLRWVEGTRFKETKLWVHEITEGIAWQHADSML